MLDVDDLYPEHPKLVGLGTWCEVAGWLNLAALAWSKRYLTDGRIPRSAVWRLASFRGMAIDGEPVTPEAVAAKLVEARLWRELGADYVIHDYLAYQESRVVVLERRRVDRERKRKGRDSRWKRNVQPDSDRNPAGVRPESDGPLPSPSPDPSPSVLATKAELWSGARAHARSSLDANDAGRARGRADTHRAEPRSRAAMPELVR